MLQEYEEKPEDCIPEDPGNEDARRFLAQAPTRGLWMPLGKEVKVMQCEYKNSYMCCHHVCNHTMAKLVLCV